MIRYSKCHRFNFCCVLSQICLVNRLNLLPTMHDVISNLFRFRKEQL
jgi:hypothetical protein